ncbi:MAG: exodeoxyribonuclease V subunit beta [Candidatus Marinimicrobia bacterium]|nr:exodeoxyribonuclease V subunit beta [Candidatus Neomarinimicrobiota bacterium]
MTDFSQIVFSDWTPDEWTLVEASAGTGKTYNMQNAYLRLVLEAGLTVQQILVVTFTEAATRELRDRLRRVLVDCRNQLEQPQRAAVVEDRIRAALAQAAVQVAPADLITRIRLALMDFDNAAIFTIHGFCNRVLERYAFECGHDPEAELLSDPAAIIQEVCQDWWRQHAYPANAHNVPFPKLETLVALVTARAQHPDAALAGPVLPATPAFDAFVAACQHAWQPIGNLRGQATWIAPGQLLPSANAEPVDLSALVNAVNDQAAALAAWAAAHPIGNEAQPESSLRDAMVFILRQMANPPAAGDAKPFRKCLKTIATEAPANSELARQIEIVEALVVELRRRLEARGALTYDAMLYNVRAALRDATAGPRLREVLRQEFKAALIDEFQDTDSVQWGIFSDLFRPDAALPLRPPLLLVGDPKQAIYGFRGGDVFTYFEARRHVPESQRYSLSRNYRSEPNLVAAINELFQDGEPGATFRAGRNIVYPGDLDAHGLKPEQILLRNGQPDPRPLQLWMRTRAEKESVSATSALARGLLADTAREIVRLLSDDTLRFGGPAPRAIQPSDIAVLVLTHGDAAHVQKELIQRGVNAVRQAAGNVFTSPEAPQLALVMQALLSPANGTRLRSALTADFIPCPVETIARFNREAPEAPPAAAAPGRTLEEWTDIFQEAGRRWHTHSFIEAFRFLAHRLDLRAHVLGLPDGARRLTDLLHLVERVHQAARAQQLAPAALLRWFSQQRTTGPATGDEADASAKTRLADDDDAVKIMTIFKSKGLQFPIVFLPTLWRRQAQPRHRNEPLLSYHDDQNRLVLDLDTAAEAAKDRARAERLGEDIRLAYVGLTRAVNRVYLLAVSDEPDQALSGALAHLLAHWRQRLPGQTPGADSYLRATDLPLDVPDGARPPEAPGAPLERPAPPKVDQTHGHASFSSLTAHDATEAAPAGPPGVSLPDEVDVDQVENEPAPAPEPDEPPAPIFTIPGGAKLGTCWHTLFERLDFQADDAVISRVVNDALDQYRLCPQPTADLPPEQQRLRGAQRQAVHDMVRQTLTAPLDAGYGPFNLRDIPLVARRSELDFHFALQDQTVRGLHEVAPLLEEAWQSPARDPDFIAALAGRRAPIPLGFMTGSIDLVFERAGRFYLVDWKSNQLNRRPDDFHTAGLAREMRRHAYYLQYLIYVVALDGYLAGRLRDYDYDRHFGGVFYLFLRGIGGDGARGIFHDRPPRGLIQRLATFFTGDAG